MTRRTQEIREVFALKACGHTDRRISERTGVPIHTIRQWRKHRLSGRIRRALDDNACDACGAVRHDFASGTDVDASTTERSSYLNGNR
jgi:hypothetical protein